MKTSAKLFFLSILLFMLGAACLSTPNVVSAGGPAVTPSGPPVLHVGEGVEKPRLQETFDHLIYLPIVTRRYPPIPYAPELDSIATMGLWKPYTLTWQAPVSEAPVLYYTLQESADAGFAAPTSYTGVITTYTISDKSFGVHHYRVRGHSMWGAGDWSNIESVQFLSFLDDFNHASTGWMPRRTSAPDISLMTIAYTGHELETMVADKFDFAIFSPMVPAPATPYRIRLMSKVLHKVNETSYGIAFGGNGGTFCRVERDNATDPHGCFSHYYRLNVIWAGNYLKYNVSRVDSHGIRGEGISQELRGFSNVDGRNPADWQTWDIWVYEDRFGLSVNGEFMAWIYDTTYLNDPYFGIFSSTYEYNYAHFAHTVYYVEPITPEMHLTLQTAK